MRTKLPKKYYILALAFFVVVATFIIYNESEYGFSKWKLVKTGAIKVEVDDNEAFIFINNKKSGLSGVSKHIFSFKKLAPGEYSVLVAKSKHWPWHKKIQLEGSETIGLHPFIVPMIEKAQIIINDTEQHKEILSKIKSVKLPTEQNRIFSPAGTYSVWVDQNEIIAEKNDRTKQITVFSGKEKIKWVDFFKNRDDVVMFAFGNSMYVIEFDKNGGQNFQPLYEGTNPRFLKKDFQTLYIYDSNTLVRVSL